MKALSIGEVARRTGVRASALRFYEAAGLLPPPARLGGRRIYEADVIRRVNVLRFAQEAGFTLQEVKTLFHGFGTETPLCARWQSLANRKLRELDTLTRRIRRMRRALALSLECGCVRIEDCTFSPASVDSREHTRGSRSR